jgi:hypothetical protein
MRLVTAKGISISPPARPRGEQMLPTIQTLSPYLTAAFVAAVFLMVVAVVANRQSQKLEQAIKQPARLNHRARWRNIDLI